MQTPHPWRRLRGMTSTFLHWRTDLPPYLLGVTDGERIWMRSDLSQVERRCVLAHELEHLDRGHVDCQPGPVEDRVQAAAARYLLPDPHLVADALVWAGGRLDEAADVLWVTERVLRARLDRRHLHPVEKRIIRDRFADADIHP